MNAGIEIILERIKTHPEEFVTKGGGRIANGKWSRVIDNYSQHLDKEDYDAIKNAIDKVQQDYFTEEVMTILVDGRDIADDDEKKLSQMAHSVTLGAGTTPVRSSVTLNGTNAVGTWGTSTIQQTLAQLEEIKKEYETKKPKHWWNKTLPELLGRK